MNRSLIYTIGHSTHPIVYFLELLELYQVNCIVDVRSLPASRFNPQFNKKSLTNSLEQHGIKYFHFGEEFGARQTDPQFLTTDGRVDFDKIRSSDKFKKGIERLQQGVRDGFVIALMCSEGDPLNCHRFSLISIALTNFEVKHILKDKSAISQEQLEDQLLEMYAKKLPTSDMFQSNFSRNELLKAAYRLKNKEVGYSPKAHTRGSRR